MATNANPVTAAAKKARAPRTAKKPNGQKKAATTTQVRSTVPYKKIAAMYEAGKSTAEISDALELTRNKTRDGKVNKYPHYIVVGALYKLSKGVKVGDETIKIKRG